MSIRGRRAVIAAVAFVSAAPMTLAADDSGVHAFLSNLTGEAGHSAAVSQPAPAREAPRRRVASARPLTVHRPKPVLTAAAVPTAPGKVTIYEDPTLRPGDAVMMADGIRVFAGSRSWPYAKADFVTLGQARDLNRDTVKVLVSLNSLPRDD